MTDAAAPAPAGDAAAPLVPEAGILLQGGRMLLVFETAAPLPISGRIVAQGRVSAWHAASWPAAGVGTADGPRDGTADGMRGGTADGMRGGTADGPRDGTADGMRDGTRDGARDRTRDRTADGGRDSLADGAAGGAAFVAVAVVDAMPPAGAILVAAGGARRPLAPPAAVDLLPDALVARVRAASLDTQGVYAFLVRHLVEGRPADCEAARAHRAFARAFLLAAAEPDGFIEIVAAPDCGGLFLQGWSLSLEPGPARVTSVTDDLALREVEIALFERPDVLAPARGCCLFGKGWTEAAPEALRALFFDRGGRLARLDVVPGPLIPADGASATEHVAGMLPRLDAPPGTLRAFRRVCRPRYPGCDTLSETPLPVAAAVDILLQAPDGRLLAAGWLLDPARRVEMAIIKTTGGLYAPIHKTWARLPRPDVAAGFAADPRFADCLDPGDVMHGFVAAVAPAALRGGDAYLELVLDDGVLFRPLRITAALAADRLAPLLPALAPAEPEFGRIVADHLAPFLAALPPRLPGPIRAASPIALGARRERPRVDAIMPLDRLAELQPVFALLGGSPDAAGLCLTLVLPRSLAREGLSRIEDGFAFHGLAGTLVVVPDGLAPAVRLDAGLEATGARHVLAWHPSALPQRPGWLAALMAESEEIGWPNLLSPGLLYEDGSIFFAGASASSVAGASPAGAASASSVAGASPAGAASASGVAGAAGEAGAAGGLRCARVGYDRGWLEPGEPREVRAAPAEVALAEREALIAAGGFSGRLFSGRFAHLDLARRLAELGIGSWCSGRVVWWKLDDPAGAGPEAGPVARILAAVDEAILAAPASPASEMPS